MSTNISRCGIACNLCPWSKIVQDSISNEEYDELKAGCKEMLGFAPTKSFQNCLGCMTPDEDIPNGSPIPLTSCKVRKCTMMNGIDNCAYCSRFPCGRYIGYRNSEWNRYNTEKKLDRKLTNSEYEKLIQCWEAEERLTTLRNTLKPDQIVEPHIMSPLKIRVKKFPNTLKFPKGTITSLNQIHNLFSAISVSNHNLKDIDVYIQQQALKSQIDELLRFLWIIGTFSSLNEQKETLIIDAKSFLENRKGKSALGTWNHVDKIIRSLITPFGIKFEFVPLSEGWKMKSGYLRKKSWTLEMTFTEKIGGFPTLKTFHKYCHDLTAEFANRSYSYFKKADMRIYE